MSKIRDKIKENKEAYNVYTFKDQKGYTIALYKHKENPSLNKAYVDVGTEITRINHANKFSDLIVKMYRPSPEERQIRTHVETDKATASLVRKHLKHTHNPNQRRKNCTDATKKR